MGFQCFDETDAVEMSAGERLVAGNHGDELLLRRRGCRFQLVVVEAIGAFAIFLGIGHEPRQHSRTIVHVGVLRALLAGAHHTELPQVAFRVNQHRLGFGGQHDGVLGCHVKHLGLAQTFSLHHHEIRVVNLLLHEKLIPSVERHQLVPLALPVVYRSQFRPIGYESHFYHIAKVVQGERKAKQIADFLLFQTTAYLRREAAMVRLSERNAKFI